MLLYVVILFCYRQWCFYQVRLCLPRNEVAAWSLPYAATILFNFFFAAPRLSCGTFCNSIQQLILIPL